MEYIAKVKSSGPLRRESERRASNLEKAKVFAIQMQTGADEIVKVIVCEHYPILGSEREVWELKRGCWLQSEP